MDYSAILVSPDGGAYVAFIDHLLYSAEQMLEVSEGWEPTFLEQFAPHTDYVCSPIGPTGDTEATSTNQCPATSTCG